MRQELGVPLLNIVSETMGCLPAEARRVTVLATPPTLEAGVYQAGLAAAEHRLICAPDWQSRITALIQMIKAKTDRRIIGEAWNGLLETVRCAGADTVILACTDLSPLAEEAPAGMLVLDSAQALAKAVVNRYRNRNAG